MGKNKNIKPVVEIPKPVNFTITEPIQIDTQPEIVEASNKDEFLSVLNEALSQISPADEIVDLLKSAESFQVFHNQFGEIAIVGTNQITASEIVAAIARGQKYGFSVAVVSDPADENSENVQIENRFNIENLNFDEICFDDMLCVLPKICNEFEVKYELYRKERLFDGKRNLKHQIYNHMKSLNLMLKKLHNDVVHQRVGVTSKPFVSILKPQEKAKEELARVEDEEDPFGVFSDEIANNSETENEE